MVVAEATGKAENNGSTVAVDGSKPASEWQQQPWTKGGVEKAAAEATKAEETTVDEQQR